jgi:hypothetical protein
LPRPQPPRPTLIQNDRAQVRTGGPPSSAVHEPKSFLDLIKNRKYKLRPPETQPVPKLRQPESNPSQLTLQELMKKAADI